MKKSLKLMALGLAVVPCALMLTACGGTDDKNIVDIKGDYVAVEANDYQTVVNEIDAGFDLEEIAKGLKSSITINANASLGEMGRISLNLKNETITKANAVDGFVTFDGLENYSKISANMKMTAQGQSQSMSLSAKQYVVDGVNYIDASGAEEFLSSMGSPEQVPTKFYINLGSEDSQPVQIPEYNLSDLLAMVPEGEYWGDYVTLSKSVEETTTKYKVVMNGEVLEYFLSPLTAESGVTVSVVDDLEFYVIYENETFAGAYLSAEADVNVAIPQESDMYYMFGSSVTVNVKINAQFTGFEGEISYPSFNNYVDMTDSM